MVFVIKRLLLAARAQKRGRHKSLPPTLLLLFYSGLFIISLWLANY